VTVWLWDAPGPASNALGVCDRETGARQAAAARLRGGQASAAVVEQAVIVLGAATLEDSYQRTGNRWRARPGTRVRWRRG
jgi:hypothetical protein